MVLITMLFGVCEKLIFIVCPGHMSRQAHKNMYLFILLFMLHIASPTQISKHFFKFRRKITH